MTIITLDGIVIEEQEEEKYKAPSISPFEFVEDIQYNKKGLVIDEWSEKQYNAYIVNKALSFGIDTVIQANEMNSRPHLDKKLQYDFLINSIRRKKRYNKWIKAEKQEAIDIIKQYYKYNTEKAYRTLELLSEDQLQTIKEKLFTGGLKHGA